jgi:hypothetical protein
MISAFQSREFGFGFQEVTDEELARINSYRRETKPKYEDEEAAMEVLKTANKAPLTKELNFVYEFDYGKNKEGYWNYNYMVIQLEDCVDVVKALYGDQFEYVFLFDHSCGHDKKRANGLDASSMNSGFGGKQPCLHDSTLTEGCLGPFEHDWKLKVGDVQCFIWKPNDIGPFYMTPQERALKRDDVAREGVHTKEHFSVKKLKELVEQSGFGIPLDRSLRLKRDWQEYCEEKGIATFRLVPKVDEGWVGKPKGLLQVLWERGWIDPDNVKAYTMKGQKKADGSYDVNTSLSYLMTNCEDFINEKTLLQHMGEGIGVTIDRTPKCHAELAGEGIEYSWGKAKQYYRNIDLKKRRTTHNFRHYVRQSLSRTSQDPDVEAPLSSQRVRKFSRRARRYIMAYYQFHTLDEKDRPPESVSLIEYMVKNFRTHRNASDFARAFLKSA